MRFSDIQQIPKKNWVKCNENVGAAAAADEENLIVRPLFFLQSDFFARSTPRFDVNFCWWLESTASPVHKGSTRSRCDAATLLLSYVFLWCYGFVYYFIGLFTL